MRTRPYEYQRECALEVAKFGGRALIALPMRRGKSLVSLLWASWNPNARPIVIVCPASLKWMWQRQCRQHFGWEANILEGTRPSRLSRQVKVWVVNYEVLKDWVSSLRQVRPKLVILDEAVKVKNPSTKCSKASKRLCGCRHVEHVLALSGTPITTRPSELWHTLHLVRPDLYRNFAPFAHAHCAPRFTKYGWVFDGAENLGRLHRRLKQTLLVRRNDDELPPLARKVRSVVPLPLRNPATYEKARDEFLEWMSENKPDRLRKAMKAQQVTQLGYLKRLAAEEKLPYVIRWVKDYLEYGEGKLILFAIHRPIIAALQKAFSHCCVVVNGSVTGHKRQLAFDAFDKNSKVRLLIGNVHSGWEGGAASCVAFCELWWAPGDHMQAEDRALLGDKQSFDVVYLVGRDTIETRIAEVLQRRQKNLMQILDGRATTDGGLDIYDMLSESLLADKLGQDIIKKGEAKKPKRTRHGQGNLERYS